MGREELQAQIEAMERAAKLEAAGQKPSPEEQIERAGLRSRVERLEQTGEYGTPGERSDLGSLPRGTRQPELLDQPIGETVARKARLLSSGAVQGAGDIVTLPAMALDAQFNAPPRLPAGHLRGVGGPRPEPGSRPSRIAPGIQEAFGEAANYVAGGVTPQDTGEKYTRFVGEEAAAGAPVAWGLRKLGQAKVAAGKANRFWTSVADETPGDFVYQESVGALGSAFGRLAGEESGALGEMTGAVLGDLAARNIPGMARRSGAKIAGFVSMKFESKEKQLRRMQEEIIDVLRKPGGIEEFARTPKGLRLLNEAAEHFQFAMGREFNTDAALGLVDELEQMFADFGIHADDMAMPALLDNPGLRTLLTQSIANNPDLAVHYLAASERGSSALRRAMAEIGPPEVGQRHFDSQLDNATTYIEAEANRRIQAVARQADEIEAARRGAVGIEDQAAADALGDFNLSGAAAEQKAIASEAFAEALIDSWLKAKEELVKPKYDRVQELFEQHKNLRMGVSHSKSALAEVLEPLREAGKLRADLELFEIIKNWSPGGVEFAQLRDMSKTLGDDILKAKKANEFAQADHLQRLKNGVDADMLEFELLEIDVPARPAAPDYPDRGVGPSEDNTVGLGRERTAEARARVREGDRTPGEEVIGTRESTSVNLQTGLEGPFEGLSLRQVLDGGGFAKEPTLAEVRAEMARQRQFLGTAQSADAIASTRRRLAELEDLRQGLIERGRQPGGPPGHGPTPEGSPGTVGRAVSGPSEDSVIGLAGERSREIVSRALRQANNAYKRLAREYYDPIATGKIMKGHRTKSPVAHGDQLGLYLKPGPIDKPGNYRQRVDELWRRSAKHPEVVKQAQDWLVADAYQRSVRMVEMPDGSMAPRLDRKALDKWKQANGHAINRFSEVKRYVDDADELVRHARELGASPIRTPLQANSQALESFISDPQKFWDTIPNMGIEKGRKAVVDVIRTIVRSGDERALDGLRESFMTSQLVRQFTVEFSGEVGPESMKRAIDTIVDTPALMETATLLFGPENARLFQIASKQGKALAETGKLPSSVQQLKLLTPGEQFQEAATKGSLYNVIMGPIRRTSKLASMAEKFNRNLTLRQRNAIVHEAGRNMPLLRDMLTRDPSAELIRGLWYRMGANYPTLFPRAERNQLQLEEEKERRAAPPDKKPNRSSVTPPRTSLLSPSPQASGRIA